MTERDFAYWLQGYFELVPPDAIHLTGPRIDCIKRHMALVQVTEPARPSALCSWIEGALEVGGAEAVRAIRARLAQHFKHVIDPQHPAPSQADQAHHGLHDPFGVKLRCWPCPAFRGDVR